MDAVSQKPITHKHVTGAIVTSVGGIPTSITVPPSYDSRYLIREVENQYGVWLEWEGTWKNDGNGNLVRRITLSQKQPTHRITQESRRHVVKSWLVLADTITEHDGSALIATWTHTEWNGDEDACGAISCNNNVWKHHNRLIGGTITFVPLQQKRTE